MRIFGKRKGKELQPFLAGLLQSKQEETSKQNAETERLANIALQMLLRKELKRRFAESRYKFYQEAIEPFLLQVARELRKVIGDSVTYKVETQKPGAIENGYCDANLRLSWVSSEQSGQTHKTFTNKLVIEIFHITENGEHFKMSLQKIDIAKSEVHSELSDRYDTFFTEHERLETLTEAQNRQIYQKITTKTASFLDKNLQYKDRTVVVREPKKSRS